MKTKKDQKLKGKKRDELAKHSRYEGSETILYNIGMVYTSHYMFVNIKNEL